MDYPIRINVYLREQGVASRREADVLISNGKVLINGYKARLGDMVQSSDNIEIIGKAKKYLYYAYYKPKGLATQDLDDKESVITKWQSKGVYPIGRLDKESEGLLLLTNDGRFVTHVLNQGDLYEKEYIVTVREELGKNIVKIFKQGMKTKTLGILKPVVAEILSKNKIKMILTQGKKHQIRIMLSELHYTVESLKRIRIGDITLEALKPGDFHPLNIKL